MAAMKKQGRQTLQETLIYVAIWSVLFIAPVLSLYARHADNPTSSIDWSELLIVWREFAVFFIAFLVHNYLLAPLLIHRRKRVVYFSAVAVMLSAFMLYQCSNQPSEPIPDHAQADFRPDMPPPFSGYTAADSAMTERPLPPGMADDEDRPQPPDMHNHMPEHEHKPPIHGHEIMHKHGPMHDNHPPVMAEEHDLVSVIVLILMLGMNIGVKLLFKQRQDSLRMEQLEKQSLEQQLEYLKFQINPHFFMNTLNNIHALVDIDPERAKETIIEMSKLMRFVLYEGNKQGVPLTREMDFIRNYITLMKLRYTDKVSISLDMPTQVPDYRLPPLMLITFVENTFKHGVSYRQQSFIDVSISLTDRQRLLFVCRNSKGEPKQNQQPGGVGLANVKKRLKLIYGNDYSLDIQEHTDTYNVTLEIPLT